MLQSKKRRRKQIKKETRIKINTSYFENSGLILLILIEMKRNGILKGKVLVDYLEKSLSQLSTEEREKIRKEVDVDGMDW